MAVRRMKIGRNGSLELMGVLVGLKEGIPRIQLLFGLPSCLELVEMQLMLTLSSSCSSGGSCKRLTPCLPLAGS